jgi:5'-3' exonuclease
MRIVVDLGYLMFYRYHATLRWIEFQKLETPIDQQYVLNTCRQHLISQLDKLKKNKSYQGGTFYFCEDEKHDLVWRKQIYPEYKAQRGVADDTVRHLRDIVKEVVANYGKVYYSPKLEADDVAYLIVKRLRELHAEEKIVIITSDRDYLQMLDENMCIVDGGGKEIKGCGDAKVDVKMKVIMGDKSDNIPPICKGCGKKTALMLAQDPQKLREFISKKHCQIEYDRNELLVCMDKIPNNLVSAFYAIHHDSLT